MKDNDAIARREKVFDQLREASDLRKKLDAKYENVRQQMVTIQQEIANSDKEVRKLSKLVQVMIFKDCCPVEAQLKYPEELEDPNDKAESDYGTAESSYFPPKASLKINKY